MNEQDNRVPPRTGKLVKKESHTKLSLRGLLSRSRSTKNGRAPGETASLREPSMKKYPARPAITDIPHWPYGGSQPPQSGLSIHTLGAKSSSSSLFTTARSELHLSGLDSVADGHESDQESRSPIDSWQPPPLFQAYPQSVRSAILPTYNVTAEALARLQESRNGSPAPYERAGGPSKGKKLRPAGATWSRKIYVLATSGYLLQYDADGAHDRLPEKVLPLRKESAVFASDLIPGQHWVLQVASVVHHDGNGTPDSKSLMSKLVARGHEKRHANHLLLVFESAEDMGSWLDILRREIEFLGGKKKLSETGKPEDSVPSVDSPSQQSRNLNMFSHVVHRDFSASKDSISSFVHNFSQDDVSVTASFESSDGQRLDSLRGSSNRLSFISTSQKTVVTSVGSSPSCSPVRASFSSRGDDFEINEPQIVPETIAEGKPRPNASAIIDRRQSMQTLFMGSEDRSQVNGWPRPPTTATPNITLSPHEEEQDQRCNTAHMVPNFSVPQTSGRRFSAGSVASNDSTLHRGEAPSQEHHIRPPRRSPPTALAISRPLSVVIDQPSPMSPSSAANSRHSRASNDASLSSSPLASDRAPAPSSNCNTPLAQAGFRPSPLQTPRQMNWNGTPRSMSAAPRKSVSMSDMRSAEPRRFGLGISQGGTGDVRSRSEPILNDPHTAEPSIPEERPMPKRASIAPGPRTAKPRVRQAFTNYTLRNASSSSFHSQPLSRMNSQASLSHNHSMSADYDNKPISRRRSMAHVAGGPPPAPPPTCALPPIPKKRQSTMALNRSASTIRA